MDISGFFTKALRILDKDGDGDGNDDVDEEHDNENCISNTSEGDTCLNKAIIATVWLSVMYLFIYLKHAKFKEQFLIIP